MAIVLAVLWSSFASAAVLENVGATYGIAEKDALEEIERKAQGVDWKKVISKKKVEEYRGPEDRARLPRAARDRSFPVDMTYTLQEDIPDDKGDVLYPKGYTFNPLDYVTFSKTLVVINGDDPEQVKWFAGSEYQKDLNVMLLLTEGSYRKISEKLVRPVFYADSKITLRFRLTAVPSVIRQEGEVMTVREYAVPVKGGKHRPGKAEEEPWKQN